MNHRDEQLAGVATRRRPQKHMSRRQQQQTAAQLRHQGQQQAAGLANTSKEIRGHMHVRNKLKPEGSARNSAHHPFQKPSPPRLVVSGCCCCWYPPSWVGGYAGGGAT